MKSNQQKLSFSTPKIIMMVALFILISGCSSIDVEKVRALDKVAVPMITIGKYIDMGQFSLGSVVQRLAEDEKFDLNPALESLYDKTYNDFETSLPFSIIDEDEMIGSEAYKNFNPFSKPKNKVYKPSYLLTPDGYMKYHPVALNKKKRAKVLNVIPDEADAAMFVYITYDLVKRQVPMLPVSNAAIRANINLDIYDRQGERILKIRKRAESEEDMKAVAGVLSNTEKIRSMTLSATEKALKAADDYINDNL